MKKIQQRTKKTYQGSANGKWLLGRGGGFKGLEEELLGWWKII